MSLNNLQPTLLMLSTNRLLSSLLNLQLGIDLLTTNLRHLFSRAINARMPTPDRNKRTDNSLTNRLLRTSMRTATIFTDRSRISIQSRQRRIPQGRPNRDARSRPPSRSRMRRNIPRNNIILNDDLPRTPRAGRASSNTNGIRKRRLTQTGLNRGPTRRKLRQFNFGNDLMRANLFEDRFPHKLMHSRRRRNRRRSRRTRKGHMKQTLLIARDVRRYDRTRQGRNNKGAKRRRSNNKRRNTTIRINNRLIQRRRVQNRGRLINSGPRYMRRRMHPRQRTQRRRGSNSRRHERARRGRRATTTNCIRSLAHHNAVSPCFSRPVCSICTGSTTHIGHS